MPFFHPRFTTRVSFDVIAPTMKGQGLVLLRRPVPKGAAKGREEASIFSNLAKWAPLVKESFKESQHQQARPQDLTACPENRAVLRARSQTCLSITSLSAFDMHSTGDLLSRSSYNLRLLQEAIPRTLLSAAKQVTPRTSSRSSLTSSRSSLPCRLRSRGLPSGACLIIPSTYASRMTS